MDKIYAHNLRAALLKASFRASDLDELQFTKK